GVLGQAATLYGDTQEANERVRRMEAVTADDLRRVANTYLVKEHATQVVIKPGLGSMLRTALTAAAGKDDTSKDEPAKEEEGGARAKAGGPKASAHPPAGYPDKPPVAPPLAATIDITGDEQTLDNGLRLVVVENHELPLVSMSLRLRAGAFTEDPAHPGTASMAASMITKGTVAHDAEALAADMERNAIQLGASSDSDGSAVHASALTGDAERAMRLLAEVVSAPKFDPKEFKTLRDQTATGMSIQEKTPSVIADRQFAAALWGSHPYGRPSEGTSADLKGLTPEALRAWWTTFVRPETAVLYMAGDITPKDARALAGRYLGDWEGEGEAIEVPLPDLSPPGAMHIVLVDKPGAIQSEIIAGHEGITRRNPLYPTGAVLSQVFGGAFSSRLNDVIRVQKGLTYGANGGLSSQRFGGQFRVRTFTKTPTTAETVQAVIDEVKRMRSEPPSEKELSSAVSYLVGSFAGTLETPEAVAGRLWTLDLNGLPKGWWNEYLGKIAVTKSEDVARAADELLDPSRLIIVVVGDAASVKESLEKIAPVEVITEGG
ncbi:MAG TPA: insulinase family protein, partial [Planctomycetota bacterium]|nr:insulinase family protein [Planctomycetota bacterium]